MITKKVSWCAAVCGWSVRKKGGGGRRKEQFSKAEAALGCVRLFVVLLLVVDRFGCVGSGCDGSGRPLQRALASLFYKVVEQLRRPGKGEAFANIGRNRHLQCQCVFLGDRFDRFIMTVNGVVLFQP